MFGGKYELPLLAMKGGVYGALTLYIPHTVLPLGLLGVPSFYLKIAFL
jgi:hypothetical protein